MDARWTSQIRPGTPLHLLPEVLARAVREGLPRLTPVVGEFARCLARSLGAEPGRVLAGFEQREVLVDLAELEDALYVLRSWDEKQPPLLGYFVSRSSRKWASYGIRVAGNWLNSPTRRW